MLLGRDGADDQVVFEFSGGHLIPSGGVTFAGGSGGFDVLELAGSQDADTIASNGTSVTSQSGTVQFGAGLDRLDVFGLGGADDIDVDDSHFFAEVFPNIIDTSFYILG